MIGDDVTFLLEDLGALMTLIRPGSQSYDPATGQMSEADPTGGTSYDIRAVFINYQDDLMDGSVIRAGDRRLLVAVYGSTTAPQIGDVVQGLRVIDVRTYAPNDTPIAYACQMRK